MLRSLAAALFGSLLLVQTANADGSLAFNPVQSSYQLDASGNLALGIVPSGVVTTAATCRMKVFLASKESQLSKGRIKNPSDSPDSAHLLLSIATPNGLPNSALSVATTGVSSKPKKGSIFARAALQCGRAKKTFVFSPIVSLDFSLITGAKGKASPQVMSELRSKTVSTF